MSHATATYYLDTRTKDKKLGMIKVCVMYKRVSRLYTTKIRIEPSEWQKLQRSIDENGLSSKVKNPELIEAYNILYKEEDSHLNRAKKIIDDLGERFSFDAFKYFFDNPKLSAAENSNEQLYSADLLKCLEVHEVELAREERYSAEKICKATRLSLIRFLSSLSLPDKQRLSLPLYKNNSELHFNQVTKKFLEEFVKWGQKVGKMKESKSGETGGLSSASLLSYTTQIKTLFNIAIEAKIISADIYPFGRGRFSVHADSKKKKALSKSDIEAILQYEANENGNEGLAKDIWVFSYLSNGMNVSDICRLRHSDIDFKEKRIRFVRKKTSTTIKSKDKEIAVLLNDILAAIIEKRKSLEKSNYVFPFLSDTDTEKIKKEKIDSVTQMINWHIRKIAKALGIEADITSYTARHSFATVLLKNRVPMKFISKAMGHKSVVTTERYFGDFEDKEIEEFMKGLL